MKKLYVLCFFIAAYLLKIDLVDYFFIIMLLMHLLYLGFPKYLIYVIYLLYVFYLTYIRPDDFWK
jgi:hypothetical protein